MEHNAQTFRIDKVLVALSLAGCTPPIYIIDKTQEEMYKSQAVSSEVSMVFTLPLIAENNRFVKLVQHFKK